MRLGFRLQHRCWLACSLRRLLPRRPKHPLTNPRPARRLSQREREQKQQDVEPYEKNAVERAMILAERRAFRS